MKKRDGYYTHYLLFPNSAGQKLCFSCRKKWVNLDADSCPDCHGTVVATHRMQSIPPKRDVKAWEKLRLKLIKFRRARVSNQGSMQWSEKMEKIFNNRS